MQLLLLQLAEEAVGRRIEFGNHILKRRLLRLCHGELRRNPRHVGLHQVGLRRSQLGLVAGNSVGGCRDLRDGVVDGHALLRNKVQRRAQCKRVAHGLRGVHCSG